MAPDLILASASPRRRDLLERLGLRLRVAPVDIDEDPRPDEPASDYVRRLAGEKCAAAVARLPPGDTAVAVLAADTTVTLERRIFGKPADDVEAAAMLGALAGRRHEVITAICVRLGDMTIERAVTTAVTFRLIAPEEVAAYVASGEWRGKAGGYAIQGIAAVFASDIRGSLTNVIGLPLCETIADLRASGALASWPPPAFGVIAK